MWWGWRALTAQGLGDLRLPDPGKDRQHVRVADALRGLGRDGPSIIKHGEAVPWRNSAKGGLACLSGQLTFGTGPTRSEAARADRKLRWERALLFPYSLT